MEQQLEQPVLPAPLPSALRAQDNVAYFVLGAREGLYVQDHVNSIGLTWTDKIVVCVYRIYFRKSLVFIVAFVMNLQ